MMEVLGYAAIVMLVVPGALGWALPMSNVHHQQLFHGSCRQQQQQVKRKRTLASAASGSQEETTSYRPLYTFNESSTAEKFSRIDDVIMGGVSSSTFVMDPQNNYAKWFGICRTEGGGFCGFRTLPFQEAVQVGDADGIYIFCRLFSDDEPERRVWKLTTRVNDDRGEQLYQARYYFPPSSKKADEDDREKEWSLIKIPFKSFQLVRGPRTVPNGPPLNVSGGIYQLGMTMSKFEMGVNVTEIPNFRPGFFEHHLQSVGFYKGQATGGVIDDTVSIRVLSEEQAKKKAPLFVRIFRPLSKLFFTEQSQRRKVTMKLLREKRGLSRLGAIKFGFRNRAKSQGVLAASTWLLATLLVDTMRATVAATITYGIFVPLRLILMTFRAISKPSQPKSRNISDPLETAL